VTRAALVWISLAPGLAGCRAPKRQRPDEPTPAAALRLVPDDARFVVGMDVAKVRAAPVTAKLGALRDLFSGIADPIDGLTAKTGIDPWRQLESVTVAGVTLKTEVAVVFRGRGLDQARLIAYAHERLAGEGDELVSRKRGKRTLWSARKQSHTTGLFLDDRTLVLATPEWAERIADLADDPSGAKSAASNPELAAACAEVSASLLWGAGVPPDEARRYLEGDFRLRAIGSLRRVTLAVDLAQAFVAKLAVDFADAAQADQLAEELAELIDRERREKRDVPLFQALFKGLTEYADESTFRAELRLENDVLVQTAETLARAVNWVKPPSELPRSTSHALTLKPDWLTPPPANVALSEVRSYDAWDRRTHALFEVANRGDKPVLPQILIDFRDPKEKRLDERLCLVPMIVLLPHERVGCDPGVPATAVSGIYTIRTAPDDRAAAFAANSRTTLRVVGAQLETRHGAVQWLAGQVKNATARPVRGARVHATFYDAEQKIVGYGDAALPQPVAPGASAPFRLASGPLFAPAESFTAIAYALVRAAPAAPATPPASRPDRTPR
jgi:hypothetical protein